ncbi:hypothetical protein [Luteolibacter ambystomatis]|uniref:hypothetical protein n=1 Tax=Luteolibacter ambystomatis TaxID=2824561 RepID=UPI0036DBC799
MILLFCLSLIACERREDGMARSEPEKNPAFSDLPSKVQRIWNDEDTRKMREATRKDPEGVLRWLHEEHYLDAAAYDAPLTCFLSESLEQSPERMLALADQIEFSEARDRYLQAAYGMLVRKDTALAWEQWEKRRKADKTDSPHTILSLTARRGNLEALWKTYQTHAHGNEDAALFLATVPDEIGIPPVAELNFIAGLLFSIDPADEKLPEALAKACKPLAQASRVVFHSLLDQAPAHAHYDTGRSISAAEEMKHGEWKAAAESIARISDAVMRDEWVARLIEKGGADSDEVRKILPELETKKQAPPRITGVRADGYEDASTELRERP